MNALAIFDDLSACVSPPRRCGCACAGPLSGKTVDHHVSASFEKLGVTGRREAAALMRDARDRLAQHG